MRTLAIGDVHGSLAALETLASALCLNKDDTLVMLGDYVDRGPDSRGVVEYLLALRGRVNLVALLGNHEIAMMDSRRDRKMLAQWVALFGGEATLASYGATSLAEVPRGPWEFFKSCRPYYETDTDFFVHAGAAKFMQKRATTTHAWTAVEASGRNVAATFCTNAAAMSVDAKTVDFARTRCAKQSNVIERTCATGDVHSGSRSRGTTARSHSVASTGRPW
jgi:hypothetical protein